MAAATTSNVSSDGVVRVEAFDLPLSGALSPASKTLLSQFLAAQGVMAFPLPAQFESEAGYRDAVDAFRARLNEVVGKPGAERLLAKYPVDIEATEIAGVPAELFRSRERTDDTKVLINLHGGAFCCGAVYISRIESIPVAYMSGIQVISIDYRQGHEHKFPAASQDVAAVYAKLLETYSPRQIGIYGGSAGGMLALQSTAWILKQGLPAPGGIGVFGAGTGGIGDGAYFSAIGRGAVPPDRSMATDLWGQSIGYFAGVQQNDPLANPNVAPEEFRAKFPPTLFLTGTRAFDLSPALGSHRALCQAGVDAQLHVFDGHGHCFYYDAQTPESLDAYATMIRFFRKHLSA